jgi:cytochrome c-type biogenesis protein CcmH/NrfF
MSYFAQQWILWAIMVGLLAFAVFIIIYDHRNHTGQKYKVRRRDELLTRLLHQSERMGENVSRRVDCDSHNLV